MSENMQGKPVYTVPAKTIINFESGFAPKLLCDGPTFSTGSACVYRCAFCYVPAIMAKSPHLAMARGQGAKEQHMEMVIRRGGALSVMRAQLINRKGRPKFSDPTDRRVIYASPLVDVAANMELVRETAEACALILAHTHWQIRLLSKSHLLPKVAEMLLDLSEGPIENYFRREDVCARMIFGVSTGTLDDKLAASFEEGTPLVSKRLQSLRTLQDLGYRTFGMICPSLPEREINTWAREVASAIRVDRCEHVWAEVINVRGEAMERTEGCLRKGGFSAHADELRRVSSSRVAWEAWSRETFLAHAAVVPHDKLRFLQYVTKESRPWWEERRDRGAVLLGASAHGPADVLRRLRGAAALPAKRGKDCWETLEFGPDDLCNEEAVLLNYRKLAKEKHPDAGGSVAEFQALCEAKDIALATIRSRMKGGAQ